MKYIILITILILLAGCKLVIQETPKETVKEPTGAYYCEKDADCAIKDVHNCCGYYPRCVNIAHEPDIEAVIKECQEEQIASVCGFPDIESCKCIENRCESMQDGKIV